MEPTKFRVRDFIFWRSKSGEGAPKRRANNSNSHTVTAVNFLSQSMLMPMDHHDQQQSQCIVGETQAIGGHERGGGRFNNPLLHRSKNSASSTSTSTAVHMANSKTKNSSPSSTKTTTVGGRSWNQKNDSTGGWCKLLPPRLVSFLIGFGCFCFLVFLPPSSVTTKHLEVNDEINFKYTDEALNEKKSDYVSASMADPPITINSDTKDKIHEKKPSPSSLPSCAINLYGLPRSFRHHVLPSLVVNVLEVNKQYNCDYYVHAYNKTHEPKGRSGSGGMIYPEDIYLIDEAIRMVYQGYDPSHTPTLTVTFDTDHDFETYRANELQTMIDGWPEGTPNPYMMSKFDADTVRNVLKMWHGQERVWQLMEDGWKTKNSNDDTGGSGGDGSSSSTQNHYDRVMMLRLDVVYVTPIDIFRARHDYEVDKIRNNGQGYLRREDIPDVDPYFIDDKNEHAIIPGFALYPVNDRMISGPYNAVKVWASQRFERAKSHVMETLIVDLINNQTAVIPPKVPMGRGLHDEFFVAKTLLPAIKTEYNITVHVDPDMWFMRVRADGSIWILDTPNLNRYGVELGDPGLETERQKLETVFRTYYHNLQRHRNSDDDHTVVRYCDDVYQVTTKGISSAAYFQIKCPPPANI
jgi:hypothetical protein